VAESERKKGLGSLVLEELLSKIQTNQEYKRIYLTVSPLNASALRLYLKNSFTIYDFKKDTYGNGADRVFLELNED